MGMKNYDFAGWATRYNVPCSDGRTIRNNAFRGNQKKVPLVWNHLHNDPGNVIGNAILEHRDQGVYAYCSLNDTDKANDTRKILKHGDVASLSICANQLQQNGGDVLHGSIREVSVVLAGANPEAWIDNVMLHGEEVEDDAIIYPGALGVTLYHNDEEDSEMQGEEFQEEYEEEYEEELEHADNLEQIFNTLNDEQKNMVYELVGMASGADDLDEEEIEQSDDDGETFYEEEDPEMKHNIWDGQVENGEDDVLTHADMMELSQTAIQDATNFGGSLKKSFLFHAAEYGIDNIEYLFPEAKSLNTPPDFIQREQDWVKVVMGGVHHTPFSRIKSMFADITEDEARALGYIKGDKKKEEVFSLLRRTTDPQTIYKLQKFDRDDVIDITDFDVIAWVKGEMRMMLDEEIARAILIGDGRLASDRNKISEDHIRSVYNESDLFAVKVAIKVPTSATTEQKTKAIIRGIIKAHKEYKGSGNPKMFTNEDYLTDMLLLEDGIGRPLYDTVEKLRTTLRVSDIQTVPVMENQKRTDEHGVERELVGIILNLNDYNVGADKGGAVSLFDDFDIDYNQLKYLIETRISGALIKPFSALVIELEVSDDATITYTYTVVKNPEGNPRSNKYYEKAGQKYFVTADTQVDKAKTYYEASEA